MSERIVITGMGTVSPLGLNVKETWETPYEAFPAWHRLPCLIPATRW